MPHDVLSNDSFHFRFSRTNYHQPCGVVVEVALVGSSCSPGKRSHLDNFRVADDSFRIGGFTAERNFLDSLAARFGIRIEGEIPVCESITPLPVDLPFFETSECSLSLGSEAALGQPCRYLVFKIAQ